MINTLTLSDSVLSLIPIESQLTKPITLLLSSETTTLIPLFKAAGLRHPQIVDTKDKLTTLDTIIHDALTEATITQLEQNSPKVAIEIARKHSLNGYATHYWVNSFDNVALSTHYTENSKVANKTPILLFSAPGIPTTLLNGWIEKLYHHHPIAIWGTRALFRKDKQAIHHMDMAAQLADAKAVIEYAGWKKVHGLGICGGAALALAFTALYPERIKSLSLWFGDYELGSLAPKTEHQRNLQALMRMVVDNQTDAKTILNILIHTITKLTEPDLAPLALYPFANQTLFKYYCQINYPIMSNDCSVYLSDIHIPSLVAYSKHDTTTHPESSRTLAKKLNAAIIETTTSGHLDAFRGYETQIQQLLSFIASS